MFLIDGSLTVEKLTTVFLRYAEEGKRICANEVIGLICTLTLSTHQKDEISRIAGIGVRKQLDLKHPKEASEYLRIISYLL